MTFNSVYGGPDCCVIKAGVNLEVSITESGNVCSEFYLLKNLEGAAAKGTSRVSEPIFVIRYQ